MKKVLVSHHSMLQIPNVQLLWQGNVSIVNTHGNQHQRDLIIASPGVFVFEKKIFPRMNYAVTTISFSELRKIKLDGDLLTLGSQSVSITISSTVSTVIASIVYGVHRSLFDHDKYLLKTAISDEKWKEIDRLCYIYRTESLLVDRFLSFCLGTYKTHPIELISDVCNDLTKSNERIVISGDIVASSLISAYTNAIAFDGEVTQIILKSLNVCSLLPHFQPILRFNTSVRSLVFKNVSFQGSVDPLLDCFINGSSFCASELIFSDCECITSDFQAFISSFRIYTSPIENLSISKCITSAESVSHLFRTIVASPCFHSVKKLYIEGCAHSEAITKGVFTLFSSEFMLEDQNMTSLSLVDCSIDLSLFLPMISPLQSRVLSLNLSGNLFSQGLVEPSLTNFPELSQLVLSDCRFGKGGFISVLQLISRLSFPPEVLILDAFQNDDDRELEHLYQLLPTITIPGLKHLSWNKNLMNPAEISSFVLFLLNHESLMTLEMNQSISVTSHEQSLLVLADALSKMSIQRFSYRGCGILSFGAKLLPVIHALLSTKSLVSLDIIGQGVGEKGYLVIADNLQPPLSELFVDGSFPTDIQSFLLFLQKLQDSSLSKCHWPEQDARLLLSMCPITRRTEMYKRIDLLKKSFAEKFGPESLDGSVTIRRLHLPTDFSRSRRGSRMSNPNISVTKGVADDPLSVVSLLSNRDLDMTLLLRSCLSLNVNEDIPNCFISVYHEIQQQSEWHTDAIEI